nr:hypothetical protein [Chlamydiota bacterium]
EVLEELQTKIYLLLKRDGVLLSEANRIIEKGNPLAGLKLLKSLFPEGVEKSESSETLMEKAQNLLGTLAGSERKSPTKLESRPPLLRLKSLIEQSDPKEREIRSTLQGIDESSPLLFIDMNESVLQKLGGERLSSENVKSAVNDYLLEQVQFLSESEMDTLHQFILEVAKEMSLEMGEDLNDNTTGERFLNSLTEDLKTEGEISDMGSEILWVAMSRFDEVQKLSKFMKELEMSPLGGLDSLSNRVDQTLAFFEKNQHLSPLFLGEISTTMKVWLKEIASLSPVERKEVNKLLADAEKLISQNNHVEALKLLKQGFEISTLKESPKSAIATLVEEFETEQAVGAQPSRDLKNELVLQRDALTKNLTYFTTYKLCGDPKLGSFKSILEGMEGVEGEAKEKKFKELISKQIDKSDQNFFSKLFAKFKLSITYSIIGSFAEHFCLSITDYLTSLIGEDAHLTPIKNINDALAAYRKAEREYSEVELGIGKRAAMKRLLDNPVSKNNIMPKDLAKEVVDKAIKEFMGLDILSVLRNSWNSDLVKEREGAEGVGEKILVYPRTLIAQLALTLLIRPFFHFLDPIVTKGIKEKTSKTLSELLRPMFEGKENALPTSSLDSVILEQLEYVERQLASGEGESKINESAEGKALFKELVDNLFLVLDMRSNLTAEKRKELKSTLDKGTDKMIKEAVTNLLIFIYQSVRTEESMNGIVVDLLRQANDALLLDEDPVRELYSEEEKRALATELGVEGKISDQDLKLHYTLY